MREREGGKVEMGEGSTHMLYCDLQKQTSQRCSCSLRLTKRAPEKIGLGGTEERHADQEMGSTSMPITDNRQCYVNYAGGSM